MSDHSKITAAHLRRRALVYVRQSTTRRLNTIGNRPSASTGLRIEPRT